MKTNLLLSILSCTLLGVSATQAQVTNICNACTISSTYTNTTGDVFSIMGGHATLIDSATFFNEGLAEVIGTNALDITASGDSRNIFDNLAGGTFEFAGDGFIYSDGCCVGAVAQTFNNQGLVWKSGGTNTSSVGVPFNNQGGTIQVDSGTLSLSGAGSSSSGTFAVAAGAVLDLTGGSSPSWSGQMNGSGTGQVLLNSGNIVPNPALTLDFTNDLFQWGNGTFYGGFVTNVGVVTIAGSRAALNDNAIFVNQGLAQVIGTNALDMTANANQDSRNVFDNLAGGTFEFAGDGSIYSDGCCVGAVAQTFNNQGLLWKSGGTNTSSVGVPFNNQGGTIQVDSGTLSLSGAGSSSSGTFAVAAGAVLDLTGGSSPSWSGQMNGSGTGQVLLNSGNIVPNPALTLDFTNDLFQWGNGTFYGGFVTNVGVVTIAGSRAALNDNAIFVNQGLAQVIGTNALDMTANANQDSRNVFDNLAGGTFEFAGDGSIYSDGCCVGAVAQTFNNQGLLWKRGGTNTSAISTSFNNQGGLIEVDSGILSLGGNNYAQGGGALTVTLGGTNTGQWGELVTTGNATLNGPLNLQFTPGFVPPAGSQFKILSCASLTGTFSAAIIPFSMSLVYSSTGVTLGCNGFTQATWAAGDSALHDTITTTFLVSPGTTVQLVASAGGVSRLLGATTTIGLGTISFNTTQLPNGVYSLQAIVYNAGGQVVSDFSRTVFVNNSLAWHEGTLSTSQTWGSNTVNAVDQTIIIPSGVTLTIAPGAIVKFAEGTGIIIQAGGVLDASGATASAPIIFTSLTDDSAGGDSNEDGDNSLPVVGDWSGITNAGQFKTSAFVQVRYFIQPVSGTVSVSQEWLGSVEYLVTGNLSIPSGVTLTIDPGAIVKFELGLNLKVQSGGTLVALGTVAQPITFTSVKDESVGAVTNTVPTTPQAGDWDSIYLNGGQATFDHVSISYGGGPDSLNSGLISLIAPNSVVAVSDSILSQGFYRGIEAEYGTVNVTNCLVTGCDRGIQSGLNGPTLVNIINCTVDDNNIGLFAHGGVMNVANTIVSDSLEDGVEYCCGSSLTLFQYCDVWSAEGANYAGIADQTGANGNISANPNFVNATQENYELNYGSPCINAADGIVAPLTDLLGAPCYNDPRTLIKTGLTNAAGVYPDMGAFEFVETAPSDIDLVVTSVSGPSEETAGQTVTVQWNDVNIGAGNARGPWHDTVSLVAQDGGGALAVATLSVAQNVVLGPGQSYPVSASVVVPGAQDGSYQWQVHVNSQGDIFEGVNWTNNITLADAPGVLAVPDLPADGALATNQLSAAGDYVWYSFVAPSNGDFLVTLDRAGGAAGIVMYIGQGYVPNSQKFDAVAAGGSSSTLSALISDASTQPYYIAVYAQTAAGAGSFTLETGALTFALNGVTPNTLGNAGPATLTISGGQLTSALTYQVVDPLGTSHAATSVSVANDSLVYATFDFTGLPPGLYSFQINGGTATLPNALTVTNIPPGNLLLNISGPARQRPGRSIVLSVTYTNAGGSDLASPILFLESDNGQFRLPGETVWVPGQFQILAINTNGGPAGVLPPGFSGQIQVEFLQQTLQVNGTSHYTVSLADPATNVDWAGLEQEIEPRFQPDDSWGVIFTNFQAKVGTTYGQLQSVLAQDATELGQKGEWVADVRRLLAFEFEQGDNFGTVTQRYRLGAFGRYINDPTDCTAQSDGSSNVVVEASGLMRFFAVQPGGSYVAQPGDFGTLTRTGGVYQLLEKNGWVESFRPDGRIDFWQDPNGNQTTATYTGNLMTSVSDSFGNTTTCAYNGNGQITQTTDPVGRMTVYTYDASGEHLASATGPNGTINYTFITNQGAAAQHALSSVTYADGTHSYYQYDGFGRLTNQSLDGGAQPVSYAYDSSGGMTATDASGSTATVRANEFFQASQTQNSLGNLSTAQYDANRNLTGLQTPDGRDLAFSYDTNGNLLGIVNPLGQSSSFTYDSTSVGPTTLTDALGHTVACQYDAQDNLTAQTFPDGSASGFQYNSLGNLIARTNRRGQTTLFAYDAHNLLTNTTLPNNSTQSFTYDAHRNLASMADATGTTTFAYDAADRLTNVAYPNGYSLQFAYDAGNRRIQMADQDGFTVNYSYDAVGRLAMLSDGDGQLIVQYNYDAAGRVAGKHFANGSATTNAYSSTSLLQSLVNLAADGTVLSRFDYAYDALGRVTKMTTLDGSFAYTYDANNQLTSVSLSSGRSIQYQYDGAGNRVAVVDGGTNSAYLVNSLNEYSSTGTASFAYDADGNVISKTDSTGTTTYTYDGQNHLISLDSPSGHWTYQYNALGQRTALTFDGQETDYVVDPVGIGNVVAEYNTGVGLAAHYIFGLDLTSRVDSSGDPAYYAFDGIGNTVDLIGSSGGVLNSYSYLPFGEKLTANVSISNEFTFVGQAGVMDGGEGCYFMRNRWYDPTVGHFTQPDPSGISGGTLNLYEYVNNNPAMATDQAGLGVVSFLFNSIPGVATINLVFQAVATANTAVESGAAQQANLDAATSGNQNANWGGSPTFSGGAVGAPVQPGLNADGALAANGASYVNAAGFNATAGSPSPTSGLSVSQSAFLSGVNESGKPGPPTGGGSDGSFQPGPAWTGRQIPGISPDLPPGSGAVAGHYHPTSGGGADNVPPGGLGGPGGHGKGNGLPGGGNNPSSGATGFDGSGDPNDKVNSGFGIEGFVTDTGSIFYTVDFANETNAAAPAAEVVVTDQLDTNLNWSTFTFQTIAFNNVILTVPNGLPSFTATAQVATDTNPVQVTATFNPATGVVRWVMESMNPVTAQLVTDPLAGFLPPDNAQGQGEGYLTYSVETKAGLPSGTQIRNQAVVIFDANAPIATPITTNTIDATSPTSSMVALPAMSPPVFPVSWSGQDAGSGIAGFDIYVSTNAGTWTSWLLGTTNTSALFSGVYSNTYSFYSVAYDELGIVEPAPIIPGASTVVSLVELNIARSGPASLTLTWPQGTLLQSTNLAGPWNTNAAASPYTIVPTNAQMYFKLLVN